MPRKITRGVWETLVNRLPINLKVYLRLSALESRLDVKISKELDAFHSQEQQSSPPVSVVRAEVEFLL